LAYYLAAEGSSGECSCGLQCHGLLFSSSHTKALLEASPMSLGTLVFPLKLTLLRHARVQLAADCIEPRLQQIETLLSIIQMLADRKLPLAVLEHCQRFGLDLPKSPAVRLLLNLFSALFKAPRKVVVRAAVPCTE